MLRTAIAIIASLSAMGSNLSWRQKQYLKWRTSGRGRRYFSLQEETKFYEALEKGNTDVIDAGIFEKQQKINKLRKQLLGTLSVLCLLVSGCVLMPKPAVRDVPPVTAEWLTEDERSYAVEDVTVNVDGAYKELKGQHYIVSADFVRIFRRNQDTTLEALTQLKHYKFWILPVGLFGLVVGAVAMRWAVKGWH